MAYLREITHALCDRGSSCPARGPSPAQATHELFTTRNTLYGRYCRRCAQAMLHMVEKDERQGRIQ